MTDSISLAETCFSASAKVWKDDGEILATGIGLIPRLAVGLAKLTTNPDLMMTDGEAFLISNPVPMGPRDSSQDSIEGYMTYSRVFKNIWSGFRHAMVTPSQIDCYGQTNISSIGSYDQPKVQLLGVRGFPGNFISHKNSIFIPNHSTKVFVEGEVDMVSGMGYKNKKSDDLMPNIVAVITNLGVFDFNGPNNQLQMLSLHSGVSKEEVIEKTGFEFTIKSEDQTLAPTEEELHFIRETLDPKGLRNSIFGD